MNNSSLFFLADCRCSCFPGFMLIFWNMAGVPFTYCYASVYMMKYELSTGEAITHGLGYTIFLYALLLLGYYIHDTGNAQKNRFRMEQNGSYMTRKNAFPQLPWAHIKNPTYIQTAHGNLLLTSGWFGICRKPHYTAGTGIDCICRRGGN